MHASAPSRACGPRACAATRSRTTRGRAARRSTTGATGSGGRCSGSASAPSRPIRPAAQTPFGVRRANPRELDAYLALRRGGPLARAEPAEVLDAATARGEAVFLGPAHGAGVDAARFAREFGAPPRGVLRAEIEALAARGPARGADGGDLRLTPRGRLLADRVFACTSCERPGRRSLTRRPPGVNLVS